VATRAGYIVGWLFVAACVAAYALTWGRLVYVTHHQEAPPRTAVLSVFHGRLRICMQAIDHVHHEPGWSAGTRRYQTRGGELYRVGYRRNPYGGHGRFGVMEVQVPLWYLAFPTCLFMAWRWRRRRRRTIGFEVEPVGNGR
jgi:hypothetical protein